MISTTYQQRRDIEGYSQEQLADHQLARLNKLIDEILPENQFYAQHLRDLKRPVSSLDQLSEIPYTYKDQLSEVDNQLGFAANLTYPFQEYCRFHRTSGTRGKPLIVLDTQEDWQWWIDTWQFVLDSADVTPKDRVVMAFSFGPFIGFWSAFDLSLIHI